MCTSPHAPYGGATHKRDAAPSTSTSPSSPWDSRKGREPTRSFDLNSSYDTQPPEEADDASPFHPVAGSGFFACTQRPFARSNGAASPVQVPAPPHSTGFSVTTQGGANYTQLMRDTISWERELRQQLLGHEREELKQIVWSFEDALLPAVAAIRDVSTLTVDQQETVHRWCIQNGYSDFLLKMTELQEVLHRRWLRFAAEPLARKRLQNAEVPHWIEARRLQVMREKQETASAENEEQQRRLAYFVHIQQQFYQIFLFEEGERADRMEIERLQRLHAGSIAEVIAKEYRHARLGQLRYEAMRRALPAAVARNLTAEEALERSRIRQEQSLRFKKIHADEIRHYLASSRQEKLNQRVEEEEAALTAPLTLYT